MLRRTVVFVVVTMLACVAGIARAQQSFVTVPSVSSGPKMSTEQRTQGSDTVNDERVVVYPSLVTPRIMNTLPCPIGGLGNVVPAGTYCSRLFISSLNTNNYSTTVHYLGNAGVFTLYPGYEEGFPVPTSTDCRDILVTCADGDVITIRTE